MAVFWVVATCSLVEVYQRFRGPCCLHHQDGDLWNVGKLLPDYTALQPRRQPSSYSPPWEPHILHGVILNGRLNHITEHIPEQCMQNLRWTKWHCGKFSPSYSVFPWQSSFHHCSILIYHHSHHQGVVQEAQLRPQSLRESVSPHSLSLLKGNHEIGLHCQVLEFLKKK
jgi:hypothetical protein